MQITIVVEDKLVVCDGFGVHLPALDWARFDGDPSTKWDDIQAVQYNTDHKQGHVEYKTIITQPASRPNGRFGDWHIGEAEFNSLFAWVLPAYEEEKARVIEALEAKRIADEAAAVAAAAEAEIKRKAAIARASLPQDPSAPDAPAVATAEDVEALRAQMAAIAAENQLIKQQMAAQAAAVVDTLGGGT